MFRDERECVVEAPDKAMALGFRKFRGCPDFLELTGKSYVVCA